MRSSYGLRDIVFLLDGSGSVGAANFNLVKQFTIHLASFYQIDDKQNQIGVI